MYAIHFFNIVGVRGFEPLHLGIKNQRLYLLAILLIMSGSGIEPLYMDFQSIALPLSYPDVFQHVVNYNSSMKPLILLIAFAGLRFLGQH
jgi:hypothetical protein